MNNTNLTQLVDNLLNAPKSQRRLMRKALSRSVPGLLNTKKFKKAHDAAAEKRGVERRLEMHRNSCLQAYTAKKQMVEAGQGNHKFVHPATL